MVTLSSELWLLSPPPQGDTSSWSQISSRLSKLIDITDVKSVLWWKRLQHRNIINYPPVFHQMTSLISAVPDWAAFVVTVYVRVFACVRVCLCTVCVRARVCGHVFVCLQICSRAAYTYLMRDKPLLWVFSLVWSCHQRLICHFFKSFKTVREKWALSPVADQYINSTAGDS